MCRLCERKRKRDRVGASRYVKERETMTVDGCRLHERKRERYSVAGLCA